MKRGLLVKCLPSEPSVESWTLSRPPENHPSTTILSVGSRRLPLNTRSRGVSLDRVRRTEEWPESLRLNRLLSPQFLLADGVGMADGS